MDYYILDEVAGNPDIPYIGDLPEQLDMIDVVLGKKLSIKDLPIHLPVRITDESEVVYPDIMTANLPLFSTKLKITLDSLGIDNIDYYPVELIDEETGETRAHYYMAIVLGLIECLQSGLDRTPAGRRVLKNPVIDPARVHGQRLFRLGEKPRLIIIDSGVRDALAAAGLNGVSLQRTEDYTSL